MVVKVLAQHASYLPSGHDDHPVPEPPAGLAALDCQFRRVLPVSPGRGGQFSVPVRPGEGIERLPGERLVAVLPQLTKIDVHLVTSRAGGRDCLQLQLYGLTGLGRQRLEVDIHPVDRPPLRGQRPVPVRDTQAGPVLQRLLRNRHVLRHGENIGKGAFLWKSGNWVSAGAPIRSERWRPPLSWMIRTRDRDRARHELSRLLIVPGVARDTGAVGVRH